MKKFLPLVYLTLCVQSLFSQELFTNTSVKAAIRKGTRSAGGQPGNQYWQNRGDYNIHVSFDPATNLVTGDETIIYRNNSADTLKELIIRLYPDFYKKGVNKTAIKDIDLGNGVTIDKMTIGDEQVSNFAQPGKAFHQNTNLIIFPSVKQLPQSKRQVTIQWHYLLNTGSPVRTGRVDSGSYFIAYFFPRIAVYDDINGWDDWSYNGTQEFYNDFGDFDVEITVPKNYLAWATGDLLNENDNYSAILLDKLHRAKTSDQILSMIDSSGYKNNTVLAPSPTGKWKFHASGVSDFVFAISDHYLWDASSILVDSTTGKRTLASAVYNKKHADYFDVAKQAHESVYYMSYYYPHVPFPFTHITVFDGTDQMEYPMMVNDNPTETHKDAVQLTSHEIFHSYFPFYMGINETQYAWMDEGWATIGESVISPLMGEPEDEGIFSKTRYERTSGTDKDVPLITNTKLYQDAAYFSNSYGKGGICYWVLQDMLGDVLYFKGLHFYMDQWHGKHPTPYDFFNAFNTSTRMNLNWFWQKWFFDWVYPDLGIVKVTQQPNAVNIVIENKGGLPLPIFLTLVMNNGDSVHVHYGAEIWNKGIKQFTINRKLTGKINSVVLGHAFVPDKFKEDNEWKAGNKSTAASAK